MFRKDLKVGRRKQKLQAKRAILEILRESVEPSNWCIPFFFSRLCFIGGFFFWVFCLMIRSVIKNDIDLFFPLAVQEHGLETDRTLGASGKCLDPLPFLTERDRCPGHCGRRCWAWLWDNAWAKDERTKRNLGRFPIAPDRLCFDLWRGHGCHLVARVCFVRSSRRVFRRDRPHVGIWRTHHQDLLSWDQDGHVWT